MKSKYMNYFKGGNLYQWDKDKEITIITKLDNIDEELAFCLAQKEMDKFLKYSNPRITKEDNKVKIASGRQWTKLSLQDEILYIPEYDFQATIQVELDKLKRACCFVANNLKRPILTGVNIGGGYIQASDSFSAYRSKINVSEGNVTITPTFINEIESDNNIITISYNNRLVYYRSDKQVIVGKILEGQFPELKRVYDSCIGGKILELDTKELRDFMSFNETSNDKTEGGVFSSFVYLDKNKIELVNQYNNSELELEKGFDEKICLSAYRLQNTLKQVKNSTVNISYTGATRPLIIDEEIMILPIRQN